MKRFFNFELYFMLLPLFAVVWLAFLGVAFMRALMYFFGAL